MEIQKSKGGRPKGSTNFTEHQIDKALLAIAYAGSYKEARKQCQQLGFTVNESTLRRWRKERADRYAELYAAHRPEMDARMLAEYHEVVQAGMEGVKEGIALTVDLIKKRNIRDPAQATAALAKVVAQLQDKHDQILGRPSVNVSYVKSAEEAIRNLYEHHGVDSTADVIDPKTLRP